MTSLEIISFFIWLPLCTKTTTVHITGYLFLHLTPILRWRPSRVRRVGNTIRSNWGNTFPVQMIKFFGQFVANRRTRYFFCTRYKSSSWASLLEPCFRHFCWKADILLRACSGKVWNGPLWKSWPPIRLQQRSRPWHGVSQHLTTLLDGWSELTFVICIFFYNQMCILIMKIQK